MRSHARITDSLVAMSFMSPVDTQAGSTRRAGVKVDITSPKQLYSRTGNVVKSRVVLAVTRLPALRTQGLCRFEGPYHFGRDTGSRHSRQAKATPGEGHRACAAQPGAMDFFGRASLSLEAEAAHMLGVPCRHAQKHFRQPSVLAGVNARNFWQGEPPQTQGPTS